MGDQAWGPLLVTTPDGTKIYSKGILYSTGFAEANIAIFNFSGEFNPNTGEWTANDTSSFVTNVGDLIDMELDPDGNGISYSASGHVGIFELGFVITETGEVRPILGLGIGYGDFGFGVGYQLSDRDFNQGYARGDTVTVLKDGTMFVTSYSPASPGFEYLTIKVLWYGPDGELKDTFYTSPGSEEAARDLLDQGRYNSFCFVAGTPISMFDGNIKPIEDILPGDNVLSYTASGQLVSGLVTRTFTKRAKHILDVFGLMLTPGHVTLCGDGQFAGAHVPIIDILRSDGALVREDGSLVRATTGVPVGETNDRLIWAVTGDMTAQGFHIREAKQIRLGMRFLLETGADFSVAEFIAANGGEVTDDGLVRTSNTEPAPFHWSLGPAIPNSEDYVLRRSCLTLTDIYQAAEWEGLAPALSVPVLSDIGPLAPATGRHWEAIRPNLPLALRCEHRTGEIGNRSFTAVALNNRKRGN